MAQIKHVKSARVRRDAEGNVKPNHVCEVHQGEEIKPGDAYKWISVKTGPYSSMTRYRCAAAPDWHRWDYSYSLGAMIEQIQFEGEQELADTDAETTDDWQAIADSIAERIEELAEEKRESAQNIEAGFGHPMPQSEELEEAADNLESWATEVRDAANGLDEAPDEADYEGESSPEEDSTYEDALDVWKEEAREAITDALNNSPA